ncbi:PaaI family thioesterase [Kribbella solani]|uniref:PaaI family thioesterase n=1 Tax=Kribbella solani TaxID=236067 RepID=UPI0029B4B83B|nr:PaaI family thioesterase [Kribbella solani]MDX2969503.1 PaaI family thioesterase [Kribbella solani]MDX3006105.1 PaaI family thioesterase [Kribbella solani]
MTETQVDRSRTFSWTDPAETAALIGSSTGLETLRAMQDGRLPAPPILRLVGATGFEAEEGKVTVFMPAAEFHYNPLGSVHGGVIATLLDTAAGCTVHSTLPAGFGYTSLDLMTRFIKPVTVASGVLRCEGGIISRGRRTAVAESHLYDERGKLLAHATSTCLIFEIP